MRFDDEFDLELPDDQTPEEYEHPSGYAAAADQLAEHVRRQRDFGVPNPQPAPQISGQLGNDFIFTAAAQRIQLVNVQAARPCTWHLVITNPPTAPGLGRNVLSVDPDLAFAIVQWGSFGAFSECEIDIGQGLNLDVYGDRVQVDIQTNAIISVTGAPPLRLGAFVVPGGAGSGRVTDRVTRTITTPANDVFPAGSSTFRVPPLARRMYPQGSFGANTLLNTWTFRKNNGTTVIQAINQGAMGAPTEDFLLLGIPVPPDATQVLWSNADTAAITNARLRFELAI